MIRAVIRVVGFNKTAKALEVKIIRSCWFTDIDCVVIVVIAAYIQKLINCGLI